MARPWQPLHGFRYGYPGIYHCGHHKSKPWRVKFERNRKKVNVGYYDTLRKAQAAAKLYLESDQS